MLCIHFKPMPSTCNPDSLRDLVPSALQLPSFVRQHLAAGWLPEESATVYRTPHDRFVITFESHPDARWAAVRDEQLQSRGMDSLEVDCAHFAKDLVAQLKDHLSLKEMRALAAELEAEMASRARETEQVVELLDQLRAPA